MAADLKAKYLREKRICLNRSVLDFMAARLQPESIALEFGGGFSSPWLAKRAGKLFTIETNPKWRRTIVSELKAQPARNWDVSLASRKPLPFATAVEDHLAARLAGRLADLALIDCLEDLRWPATLIAWKFLVPTGWLIFDDAQRERHQSTVDWLCAQTETVLRLEWAPGDVEEAADRLALAIQKP